MMRKLLALALVGSVMTLGCGGDPPNRGAESNGGTPAPRGKGPATSGGPGTDTGNRAGAGGSNPSPGTAGGKDAAGPGRD